MVGSLHAEDNPFVGTWSANLAKSNLLSDYQYKPLTLQIAVVFDTVTLASKFVSTSGQEQSAADLLHTDGKEHPGTLSPGVLHTARWINSRTLETRAKKDGKDVDKAAADLKLPEKYKDYTMDRLKADVTVIYSELK